ncbi:hypothetical protein R1sor_011329 [Riccia sorocarpa]|uniref:Reverse transcriptase zinc-binding domain-containing protein n=1 Tax=Riccia sorocarpa TaxID=122646 RepID=A0ABD3I0Y8_9MARC
MAFISLSKTAGADFPVLTPAPFVKFVFKICAEVRDLWDWKPQNMLLPSLQSLGSILELLRKGDFLSMTRYTELTGGMVDLLDRPLCSLHDGQTLDQIPELQDWEFSVNSWVFLQHDWYLCSPFSHSLAGFPLSVSLVHRVFSELQALSALPPSISRWQMLLPVGDWVDLCKKLSHSWIHRRDYIFLWRVLVRGFFTGSRALLFRVSPGICLFCGLVVEDVAHLFFGCVRKAHFWNQVEVHFPSLRRFIHAVRRGNPFPIALRLLLRMPVGKRLFSLLFLSKVMRILWRQRCTLMFEETLRDVSFHLPFILTVEALVAQIHRAGRIKRQVLSRALVESLNYRQIIPDRLLQQVLAGV